MTDRTEEIRERDAKWDGHSGGRIDKYADALSDRRWLLAEVDRLRAGVREMVGAVVTEDLASFKAAKAEIDAERARADRMTAVVEAAHVWEQWEREPDRWPGDPCRDLVNAVVMWRLHHALDQTSEEVDDPPAKG